MKQSVVGIVRRGNAFLVGRRIPGGEIGGQWEFPGGKCENNETHEQALIREYEEELHVQVTVGAFIGKQVFQNETRMFELFAYEVFIKNTDTFVPSAHTELQWLTLDELARIPMVASDSLFIPVLKEFYKSIEVVPSFLMTS